MIYLLSDPLFAYGLATFSVLLAAARVVHERRRARDVAEFHRTLTGAAGEQLDTSSRELVRLNRLLRERDARIEDGKADNRHQAQIIKEQAKDLRAKHLHVKSLKSELEKAHARLDRVQNILDNGTCHECPPADQNES